MRTLLVCMEIEHSGLINISQRDLSSPGCRGTCYSNLLPNFSRERTFALISRCVHLQSIFTEDGVIQIICSHKPRK